MQISPINDPSAWLAKDLEASDKWVYHLNQAEIDDLDNALAVAKAAGRTVATLDRESFPLTVMRPALDQLLDARMIDPEPVAQVGCRADRVAVERGDDIALDQPGLRCRPGPASAVHGQRHSDGAAQQYVENSGKLLGAAEHGGDSVHADEQLHRQRGNRN